MHGLTIRSIDRKVGLRGFGDALIAVGWLADHPEGVRIVRFEEHNGKSAKRRCSEAVRKMSARDADKLRTEAGQHEDGRRTESSNDARARLSVINRNRKAGMSRIRTIQKSA